MVGNWNLPLTKRDYYYYLFQCIQKKLQMSRISVYYIKLKSTIKNDGSHYDSIASKHL